MRTSPLWLALETLGGAASQQDWAKALGDQWAIAGALLHPTGDIAEELICPKSSENGCLRQIVKLRGGELRAECGDVPARCENLPLNDEEVKILALGVGRLARAIIQAFDLQDAAISPSGGTVQRLGRHEIRPGIGFPLFLGLPERGEPLTFGDLGEIAATPGPKALLIPYRSAVGPELAAHLGAVGVRTFQLDDVVIWDAKKTLGPRYDPRDLFGSMVDALPGVLTDPDGDVPPPVMNLPVGTSWSDLRFAFVSDNVVNVSYRKQPPKRVEPDLLGMKDERNGQATRQWRLLRMCVLLEGNLPRSMPPRQLKGRRLSGHLLAAMKEFERGYDRQRQLLATALKARFGIDTNPFVVRDDWFEAQFTVDASGLKQGRADQRERNFADDD